MSYRKSATSVGLATGLCCGVVRQSPYCAGRILNPSRTLSALNTNFVIWLILGGVIGWVASLIMATDAQQGMFLNVVVGIVGALLGGWLIAPLVGSGTINQSDFSLLGVGVSLLGAVALLAIVRMLRGKRSA